MGGQDNVPDDTTETVLWLSSLFIGRLPYWEMNNLDRVFSQRSGTEAP